LPKSFLAVNLSETHTFHKREETKDQNGEAATAEIEAPERNIETELEGQPT
jgi:hypothetical protein